jgi:hypothetical protein
MLVAARQSAGAQIVGRLPGTAAFQLRMPGADETTIESIADAIGVVAGVDTAMPCLLESGQLTGKREKLEMNQRCSRRPPLIHHRKSPKDRD